MAADRDRGLVHILKDLQPTHRVVQPTRVDNLDLISSGPEVPNPAELLASPRFGEFLDEVRRVYDVVIIDSAFVMAVTDPSIIGRLVDGTLLVVRASATRRDDAERTADLLRLLRKSRLRCRNQRDDARVRVLFLRRVRIFLASFVPRPGEVCPWFPDRAHQWYLDAPFD